jgi:anti-anti-sigma factor
VVLATQATEMGPGVWLIDVHGDLDLAAAPTFTAAIDDVLPQTPAVIGLVLADVPFMDSTGVSAILRAQRGVEAAGGQLAVLVPHAMPRALIRRLGLEDRLLVSESIEELFARSQRLRQTATCLREDARALRAEAQHLLRRLRHHLVEAQRGSPS